jgi:hypothetical protein
MVRMMTMTVVVSMALPEALTALDIGQRQCKKQKGEDDHEQIEHRETPSLDR